MINNKVIDRAQGSLTQPSYLNVPYHLAMNGLGTLPFQVLLLSVLHSDRELQILGSFRLFTNFQGKEVAFARGKSSKSTSQPHHPRLNICNKQGADVRVWELRAGSVSEGICNWVSDLDQAEAWWMASRAYAHVHLMTKSLKSWSSSKSREQRGANFAKLRWIARRSIETRIANCQSI